MPSLKGSQTEKNLLASFAGESQARNRYTFFSEKACEEGFEQIAAVFLETAQNEMEHARLFFSLLEGGDLEITASYPAGVVGTTEENLAAAAAGENMEWTVLYKEAAKVALEEGFKRAAYIFTEISEVEEKHEKRYRALLKNVREGKVFAKDGPVRWKCRNCGYVHTGKEAPAVCDCCAKPQSYFEVDPQNY